MQNNKCKMQNAEVVFVARAFYIEHFAFCIFHFQ
jgi:hypothetical protein